MVHATIVPTFAPTTTMTPTLAPTALKTFAPTADLTYLSTFYAIVACAACIPALCLCFAIEWQRMHPKAREPRHPGVGGCNAPDWKDNTCRTYLRPFTLMMCGFTALGAFLLSVAYKGGSSPVAGIVLLSIGGACNLWACFWRMQPLGGGDGDDRFCTDHDCAPIGCHYVPVFLMIGGAALGLSDGDVGLMVWGVICLFAGLVLILRWRARIFCSAVERQASERRQLEEREERARAAVPGAARVHLRTLAGESLPLDVNLPDETVRLMRLRVELITGVAPAAQRLFAAERLLEDEWATLGHCGVESGAIIKMLIDVQDEQITIGVVEVEDPEEKNDYPCSECAGV